ncbi:hypothetical protein H1R17_12500 [Flavobacterium sp. xlx-214]|uniref:hypothetical protein n=1 Tax=unclassified Flavobacterium TaxID=196869 RepID=UPI0013D71E0C|nr:MULTISPECIES: hypothetical protein [unclassified Flavobacterium]MBA5793715.1 hypothetical protein [Flavobacterium sp. xlx-221]QMI83263.1 hypothetical protein H1R17_12500 [Flavobacterium sp. xlx-214]
MTKNIIIILFILPMMCFGQQEKDLKKKFKSLFRLEKPSDIRWIAINKEYMYFENDTLVFFRHKIPEDQKIITWNFSSAKYFYQGWGFHKEGSFAMSSVSPPKNLPHKLKIINEKENTYFKVFYDNRLETVYKVLNIEFLEGKDYKVTLVREN